MATAALAPGPAGGGLANEFGDFGEYAETKHGAECTNGVNEERGTTSEAVDEEEHEDYGCKHFYDAVHSSG